nr:MAG TPA_asm: hypothetical protein [Caudoviricetes sp.]DAT27408.1 MAG TPA: hypothetical protein [Caudoviricetes sp.]
MPSLSLMLSILVFILYTLSVSTSTLFLKY